MNWLSYLHPLELIKINTPINGELRVVENFGKKILYANNNEQSGGTITGMWRRAVQTINDHKLTINNCLILGLGGGTLISLFNKYYPQTKMTVIELDPVVIDIAAKYFGIVPSPNLAIIHADAFFWIKNNKNKFDTVIFDIYWGKFNPPEARTPNFLKDLKRLLNRSGFILYNSHYQKDEDNYRKFLQSCKKVFSKAELILSYPYSRILLLGN